MNDGRERGQPLANANPHLVSVNGNVGPQRDEEHGVVAPIWSSARRCHHTARGEAKARIHFRRQRIRARVRGAAIAIPLPALQRKAPHQPVEEGAIVVAVWAMSDA